MYSPIYVDISKRWGIISSEHGEEHTAEEDQHANRHRSTERQFQQNNNERRIRKKKNMSLHTKIVGDAFTIDQNVNPFEIGFYNNNNKSLSDFATVQRK